MGYLSYCAIEDKADQFLKMYHPAGSTPVPIEEIAECKLKLEIITHKSLFKMEAIDAFLSSDFKELHIDEDHYMGQTNRSRFTIAHEVGHYVLHKSVVPKFKTIDEWKTLILNAGEERDLYEWQANDFAGCVLIPRALALAYFNDYKKKATEKFKEQGMAAPDDAMIIAYAANQVARTCDTSTQVAEIRLTKILKFPRN